MDAEVNVRELAALVRAKRGQQSLRTAAAAIGDVSASTLIRVEQGKVPDLDTFIRICRWLDVSPQRFFPGSGHTDADTNGTKPAPGVSTRDVVTAHLRADRTLDPATAEALATMVRLAYDSMFRGEL